MRTPRSFSRRGFTLVEIMIIAAVIAVFGAIIVSALGGSCSSVNSVKSITSRYDVVGLVTAEPRGKVMGGNASTLGQSKFALSLKNADGRTIVNCDSTQCAELQKGDCVQLSCFNEVHIGEPNEVECRYAALLSADICAGFDN